MTPHPDWLIPDWPAPARVRALCTTRAGGVSSAPYDSLNLGDHVQDDPRAVAENRARLRLATGGRPVFLQQVHGREVLQLTPGMADGRPADACVTNLAGLVCTIMVADCLPLLLTDREGTTVAAAHAGWRGLAGTQGEGVVETVFRAFQALRPPVQGQSEAQADRVMAWLGPCIGPQAFEVGREIREAFCAFDAGAARWFRPSGDGRFYADLAALARRRLQRLGIEQIYGNDSSVPWCTVSNPSRFFSFRRDQAMLGGSGRLAACIWLS